jgi:propanol-preferring alcohol dehydrogenase
MNGACSVAPLRLQTHPVAQIGGGTMKMRAARMHGYHEPFRLEEVPAPDPAPDEVLVKVAACGMCRSDYQLIDGYFAGRGTDAVPGYSGA